MTRTMKLHAAAVCMIALASLAACGGGGSTNKEYQVDDFPWIGYPSARLAPVADRPFGLCSSSHIKTLVGARKPDMMALGGSVFNGVSSMQINWWTADWSPPAQVARALKGGITNGHIPGFQIPLYPDYGKPPYGTTYQQIPTFRLGLDLETTNLSHLPSAVRRQGWVMEAFKSYRTDDGVLFNDNLAFAGAAAEDLLYGTARDYRRRLETGRYKDMRPRDLDRFWDDASPSRVYNDYIDHAKRVNGLIDAGKTAGPLKTIFFAENSSFVLNPTQDKCLEDLTPLDQVLLRQPRRLLVGVGSNSGLFTFLSSGQPTKEYCSDIDFTFGTIVTEQRRFISLEQTAKREFLEQMDTLLDKLAAEGNGIEHIYVMGQLRPSAVANLKPVAGQGYPGLHQLYEHYELDFAYGGGTTIDRAVVKEADDLNDAINRALEEKVNNLNRKLMTTRFIFVSLDTVADKDFKHTGNPDHRIAVTDKDLPGLGDRVVYLDNRVLKFSRREEPLANGSAGQHIAEGGFFSIDNLHPTVVGYSLLANALLDAIVATEGIHLAPGAKESISPQAMYARYAGALDGNVLRRQDKSMASREDWFQFAFDLTAGGGTKQTYDCWPVRPGMNKYPKQVDGK